MTKTLTEQWREGTLPGGFYYLEMNDGLVIIDHTIYVVGEKIYRWELSSIDYVKEVLEPVPSYEEYQDILQQNVNQESAIETYIEGIKHLQEQLNEANEVIKTTKKITGNIDLSQLDYEHRRKIDSITTETDSYLEKWGVK